MESEHFTVEGWGGLTSYIFRVPVQAHYNIGCGQIVGEKEAQNLSANNHISLYFLLRAFVIKEANLLDKL